MKHKPFAPKDNYIMLSNYLLDEVMPSLKATHWAVLCFIMRKTVGWQKTQDALSYSQIMNGTGINGRATVMDALSVLAERNFIKVVDRTSGKINLVQLNTDFEVNLTSSKIEQVEDVTSSKIEPPKNVTSSKIEPEPVQNLNTQKKEINKDDDLATPKPTPSDRDGRWTIAKVEAKGFMYMENNARALAMKLESEYTDTQLLQAIETTHQAHMKKIATGNRGITAPLAYIASVLAGNQPVAVNGNGNGHAPIRKTQSARNKMRSFN